ncbi:aminopeptidase PepB [Alteromonas lipolytica]|uniref:Aminopeptidase PepB n=1 Tax=Alteromonas lipolytica TaxID=1856405 RepID=A0A1E8FKI7_9ALTE|nr:aminopeptidase PepB [Alteromonas lipolytica]OFI36128.1 aminopeptidase PepB [Alteromonas lipolytica]GGF86160.1 aminopeptidase PepB [Alteromonas lipolytica]
MTDMKVKITRNAAPEQWGDKALISLSGDEIHIHIPNEAERLRLIRKAARQIDSLGIPSVTLSDEWSVIDQVTFVMSFSKARNPGAVTLCDNAGKPAAEQQIAAMMFARKLTNDTPEQLAPAELAQQSADWLLSLKGDAVTYRIVSGEELAAEGWIGIYNVGRGSERPPALLELDYNPTGQADAPVAYALVGKGITFDSGGYSMKSSEGMLDMKCDMGGAATVTGALGLAMMQGLNKRVKLFLCCAENLVSGHAYKLGDVLTYKNGVSVEIVNTDAEGRLVLADGLLAASESQAQCVIDAATLTGAATVALGYDYHAVFSLNPTLSQSFLATAQDQQELFWPLPLQTWHQEKCPSAFADTANSRPQKGGGAGGASNAAGFLSRFVTPTDSWLHLDLAAAYHGSATSEMPAGATAAGIRTLAAFIGQ